LRRAFVFVNPISRTMAGEPGQVSTVLAHVIAHELGHLLLPEGHSPTGLMRASLDPHGVVLSQFTDDQSRAMRAALVERTSW
jgi:hypothetical protein